MPSTDFVDKDRSLACILREADGGYSRDRGVLASNALHNLKANTVIGKITASGKWAVYTPGAADGSQNAAGILLYATNAATADADCVVLVRDSVVNEDYLQWGAAVTTQPHRDTAIAALKAMVGPIVVRS